MCSKTSPKIIRVVTISWAVDTIKNTPQFCSHKKVESHVYAKNFHKAMQPLDQLYLWTIVSRKCYHYTFEVVFPSKERKALFSERIEAVQ